MIKIELSAPEVTLIIVNGIIVLSMMVYLITRTKPKQEKPEDEESSSQL